LLISPVGYRVKTTIYPECGDDMSPALSKTQEDAENSESGNVITHGSKSEYWGIISARNGDDFVFPSPVNLPEWLERTADWLGEVSSVLEIGPGKADLATQVLSEKRRTRKYFIADISEGILSHARNRIGSLKTSVKVSYIHADLNVSGSLHMIPEESIDKVVLINVLGYLDPDVAFRNISRVLHPGGLLRLTDGDHEFFTLSKDYDPAINLQYIRGRKSHTGSEVKPLGYTMSESGENTPYFGFRRNYSREQLVGILDRNGFSVEQFNTVIIPLNLIEKIYSVRGDSVNLSPQELDLLYRNGGRPTVDLIAKKR
jgi:ubiquinone/menaquinone biosynthesis C-methylase UbiE